MPVSAFLCSIFTQENVLWRLVTPPIYHVHTPHWVQSVQYCGLQVRGRCALTTWNIFGLIQYAFNDILGPFAASAARQDRKQLGIRLKSAVSVVSAWFPAACDPRLRFWPRSSLAHLPAFLVILHGEAYQFSVLRIQWSSSPQNAGTSILPLASAKHCCGLIEGCHRASSHGSLQGQWVNEHRCNLCQGQIWKVSK